MLYNKYGPLIIIQLLNKTLKTRLFSIKINMLFNRLSIIILHIILFFHYGKPERPDIDQSSPIIDIKHYVGENEKVRLDVLSNRQIIDVPDHPNPE